MDNSLIINHFKHISPVESIANPGGCRLLVPWGDGCHNILQKKGLLKTLGSFYKPAERKAFDMLSRFC